MVLWYNGVNKTYLMEGIEMDLGQKLKQARLDAGLSQRQLCGNTITRNMLSQIENGSAKPSMETLKELAARLGKPVSYFLEEAAVVSANTAVMLQARQAWQRQDAAAVRQILADYQKPDAMFDWEYGLLWQSASLLLAEQAIEEKRIPYAAALLQEQQQSPYCDLLREKQQLLLAQIGLDGRLPSGDALLLAKAKQALKVGDLSWAKKCLDACEEQTISWHLLLGEVYFAQGDYKAAVEHFQAGEDFAPETAIPRLEECYKALEDYKMAYFYACKGR